MHNANNSISNNQIKRGEIWFVNLNTSNEQTSVQQGFRPVIIVSNNKGNLHSPIVTVIPLTSNLSRLNKLPVHVLIPKSSGLTIDSVALCEQQQAMDKSKLLYKIGELNSDTIKMIDEAIMLQCGIEKANITKSTSANIDYNKAIKIIKALSQLNKVSKETKITFDASSVLMSELIIYCKSVNTNYKEVIKNVTNQIIKTKKEKLSCV